MPPFLDPALTVSMTYVVFTLIILSNSADSSVPTCMKLGYSVVSPFTNKKLPSDRSPT